MSAGCSSPEYRHGARPGLCPQGLWPHSPPTSGCALKAALRTLPESVVGGKRLGQETLPAGGSARGMRPCAQLDPLGSRPSLLLILLFLLLRCDQVNHAIAKRPQVPQRGTEHAAGLRGLRQRSKDWGGAAATAGERRQPPSSPAPPSPGGPRGGAGRARGGGGRWQTARRVPPGGWLVPAGAGSSG